MKAGRGRRGRTSQTWPARDVDARSRAGDPDDRPAGWQPSSAAARTSVVVLHLAPGLLAYGLLRTVREPLQRILGVTGAEAQLVVIMTGVMLLMGVSTFGLARLLDCLGPRDALRLTGAGRLDYVGIALAIAIWLVLSVVRSIAGYEDELGALIERADWLALPSWHFQRTDAFRDLSPVLGGFALVANVVCEELWFRGYLQDKLRFLGRAAWVCAGVLFTLYHVFQAPVAYPRVLGGIGIAGLWAARRSLWPCVVLHALLNAPV